MTIRLIAFALIMLTANVMAHPAMSQDTNQNIAQESVQNSPLEMSFFSRLPVLHDGRIKPMKQFAQINLKALHGAERIQNIRAEDWLAGALFNPSAESFRKIIRIDNSRLKAKLKLDEDSNYFSSLELADALSQTGNEITLLLEKPEDSWTKEELAFVDLYYSHSLLIQIMRSFSFLLPLNITSPAAYNIEGDVTYLKLKPFQARITEDVKNIIQRKGEDPSAYTKKEQDLALLAFQFEKIRIGGLSNYFVHVFPGSAKISGLAETTAMTSPWTTIEHGAGSVQSAQALKLWQDMARAYRNNDAELWSTSTKAALNYTADNGLSKAFQTESEIFYHWLEPFNLALGLYGLCLLFCIAAIMNEAGYTRLKPPAFWPVTMLATGLGIHLTGLALRIIILERPPVSTLYESVLFVALIAGALGLGIALKHKNKLITATTATLCTGLLLIAPILISGSDSLEILPAVLNTNFWLGTHVITVTAGYGACMLCGCLAHIYIGQIWLKHSQKTLNNMMRLIYATSLAGLLLTSIGTVLGGIWADQSWGRFWGWDPKENGALLIVLWLIWAQHGRLSGHLSALPFAVSMAALNIIVTIAWFGVNLLGEGLHSYGFTSGIAEGLALFCAFELCLIGILWFNGYRTQTGTQT